MATGRVNVGGGGGRLNIFTQLTEPSKKEGIWIKTNRAYKKAVVDNEVYLSGEWLSNDLHEDIPYTFIKGSVSSVGSNIYIFGGEKGTREVYKFNTKTNAYTKKSDIPYDFIEGSTVTVGTDIYLFGSEATGAGTNAYKYNTELDSYERLNDIPYRFIGGATALVNRKIYLLGSTLNLAKRYNYMYDIDSGEYTKSNDIPFDFSRGGASSNGSNIYIFGGSNESSNQVIAYKYESETESYYKMTDIPYRFRRGSIVSTPNRIYIIGGDAVTSAGTAFYEYRVDTDQYTKLSDVPYQFYSGSATVSDGDIYIFGGGSTSNQKNVRAYSLENKQYTNDDIIIVRTDDNTGIYKTELSSALPTLQGDKFTRLTTGFNDVYMYYDNDLHSLEAYYGDGTQWIKFKEAE